MLNWLPSEFLAKQVAKFAATTPNALSPWHIGSSGHCTSLEDDHVAYIHQRL